MKNGEYFEEIKDLVSLAQTQKAFSLLKDYFKVNGLSIPNEILVLQSNFELAKQNRLVGGIQVSNHEINKIHLEILEFVDNLMEQNQNPNINATNNGGNGNAKNNAKNLLKSKNSFNSIYENHKIPIIVALIAAFATIIAAFIKISPDIFLDEKKEKDSIVFIEERPDTLNNFPIPRRNLDDSEILAANNIDDKRASSSPNPATSPSKDKNIIIKKGRIRGSSNNPVQGVEVYIKEIIGISVESDSNGIYKLEIPESQAKLFRGNSERQVKLVFYHPDFEKEEEIVDMENEIKDLKMKSINN